MFQSQTNTKDSEKPINTEVRKPQNNPTYPTLLSTFLDKSTVGGIGGGVAALVAWDYCHRYDNEGAVKDLGVAEGRTKDASWSELRGL